MNEVKICLDNQNKWIRARFSNKDMVSIEELLEEIGNMIDEIDDLNDTIATLEEEIDRYKNPQDYDDEVDKFVDEQRIEVI